MTDWMTEMKFGVCHNSRRRHMVYLKIFDQRVALWFWFWFAFVLFCDTRDWTQGWRGTILLPTTSALRNRQWKSYIQKMRHVHRMWKTKYRLLLLERPACKLHPWLYLETWTWWGSPLRSEWKVHCAQCLYKQYGLCWTRAFLCRFWHFAVFWVKGVHMISVQWKSQALSLFLGRSHFTHIVTIHCRRNSASPAWLWRILETCLPSSMYHRLSSVLLLLCVFSLG